MKKLVIIILTLGITYIIGRSWFAPSVRAQSVESADRELASTERDLRAAISATADKAKSLQEHLTSTDAPTALAADVQEFLKTTARLARLRDELRASIDHLHAATSRSLARFDRERALITDSITRHAMTALRTTAKSQTAERLREARASLDLLTRVLVQGTDVVHAVNCVTLAEELNTSGTQLDENVRRATEEVSAYTTMTNDLLSRLTSAYTE